MSNFYKECNEQGGMSAYAYLDDPKRIAFTAARYKHTAKMLAGKEDVLEIGCSDGLFSPIVAQHVGNLIAIDIDEDAIIIAQKRPKIENLQYTIYTLEELIKKGASLDAIYALDVFEHIKPEETDNFLKQITLLTDCCVLGIPSLESQEYASKLSKEGHVNCMSGKVFKHKLSQHFKHVFVFTMHDETLGTSFYPMSQYLLALCTN